MTSSVPYSFVPGSKAKAEEVNANFVAVLGEIEKSNVKISELEAQKADKNFSNLDEQGQEILDAKADKTALDAKADKTEIDGNWVKKTVYIASGVTMTSSYNKSFDLSSFLPDDDNIYEVIISAIIRTGVQDNNCLALCVESSLCGFIHMCRAVTRVDGVNQIASGNCSIPIAKDRLVRFFAGEETNAASYSQSCSFRISAYRKVR